MKVTINADRCQGHARCILIAPEVFDLDEQGHGTVRDAEPGEELRAAVENAARNCPENAISIES